MGTLSNNFNPFANIDLHVPNAYQELVKSLSSNDESSDELDSPPFRRMIDVWYFACCVGIGEEAYHEQSRDDQHKFHTGQVLQGDLPKIEFLLINAIAHTGDAYVVADAKKVIAISDAYAAGGMAFVDELSQGPETKLNNISLNLMKKYT
jgi:hypothetical protein